jgi:nucleotide-binding universal stress UspA family protein
VMATGADMIVLGTRTLGWEGGDVSAGAAEAVIHRTRRPVVIAPSRRRS